MVLKSKWIVLTTISVFLFSSCEFESYKDFGFEEYDGSFEWTRLVKNADWGNRYGHAAVAYKDKLWVMGGYNPGKVIGDTYYEDVWCSQDGEEWCEVLENAPWNGRRGHQAVVFNDGNGDAIFLAGGFSVDEETGFRMYNNDVWKTYDGETWIEVKPNTKVDLRINEDWFPRFNHSLVATNHGGIDYMYLMGGASMRDSLSAQYAMKYFNDVWRSTDGVDWEMLNNNDYGIRSEAGCAVDPETGRIFIQGGNHGVVFQEGDSTQHPLDDWHWLWSSDDGVNWFPENDTAIEDKFWRSDHHLIHLKGDLWSLPGKTTSKVHYGFTNISQYSIWRRDSDGVFYIDSEGIDIDARHGYASAVLGNKLYILGGFTSAFGQSNDVWVGELN